MASVPFLQNAYKYAQDGNFPAGSVSNQMYFGSGVEFESGVDRIAQMLLFDAQTSGGLLISLPPSKWENFSIRASVMGLPAWAVGTVEDGTGIVVKAKILEDVFIQGSNGFNVRFISSG